MLRQSASSAMTAWTRKLSCDLLMRQPRNDMMIIECLIPVQETSRRLWVCRYLVRSSASSCTVSRAVAVFERVEAFQPCVVDAGRNGRRLDGVKKRFWKAGLASGNTFSPVTAAGPSTGSLACPSQRSAVLCCSLSCGQSPGGCSVKLLGIEHLSLQVASTGGPLYCAPAMMSHMHPWCRIAFQKTPLSSFAVQ